ncbi:hypothetical protein [Nocardia pseudovaccinii]|uniref:hypothetical protein n=1 Tax=Nocardia pseudovaccinii TaxID=189540 RepID=UPI0007A3EC3E|nr:hypothetical protein [Nocardia pseudovaccinii]
MNDVVFTQDTRDLIEIPELRGTPGYWRLREWFSTYDKQTNQLIESWTVCRLTNPNETIVNGPRGIIAPVADLQAAAEYISTQRR